MSQRLGPVVSRQRLLAVSGWTVLLLVILLNSAGVLALDIKPEIYLAPGRSAQLFLQPWQSSPQLGWPSFNVGLAPVPAAIAAVQAVGVDAELTVRLVRLVLYSLGAWGTARLAGAVTGRRGWPVLVAAFAFVANPYAVVGGSTLAILLPMALLPWMCLAFLRSLQSPRAWRWPASVALLFAAMSGMNAGVVPLLQLLALPFFVWIARRADQVAWRDVVRVCIRTVLLLVGVSLYWLVPSVVAAVQGVTVLDNSETLEGINQTSSLSEVLRGLGFWPMYGSDTNGPWQAGFSPYVTAPVVLAVSFGVVALMVVAAVVARGPARLPLVAMVGAAAVLMVGVYPWLEPSPLGAALRWMFEHVPVTGAFRTLNKAGSVLVLGGSLLLAMAVVRVRVRHWRWTWRWAGAAALVAVGTAAVWPALSGGLYPRLLPLPSYWTQAGDQLSTGDQAHRTWFVPGEVQMDYTWTTAQPDDLALPLVARPTVLRTTLPIASPIASNLLAAVDTDLQRGQLLPGSVSAVSRYLAVDTVLVRNDTRWYQSFGARPWTVHAQVASDPGLDAPTEWGSAGENVAAIDAGPVADAEKDLPPLQAYPVKDSRQLVRAESLQGMVLIAGDGFAVAPLATSGILDKGQTFQYLVGMEKGSFVNLLGPERRIELTDTNRRRSTVLGWLAGNQGPLLPADAQPISTRALGSPDDQTVLEIEGGATVTATQSGSTFGVLSEAVPENAFDGDPRTSWQFGDFGTAVGQSITLQLGRPTTASSVRITQAAIGPVSISRVRVAFGATIVDADLSAQGATSIALPRTTADRLTVTVLATRGAGFNRVGISEIGLPGARVHRVARMPLTLSALSADLDTDARAALARTPLDVVMRRETGAPGYYADEERTLQRIFSLPDVRTYRPYGLVSVPTDLTEAEADRIVGSDGPVIARSSSNAGVALSRASFAVDGDPSSAWTPADRGVGASITVTGPVQRIDRVRIDQLDPSGAPVTAGAVTKVRVDVDGQQVAEAAVGPGSSTVQLPSVDARTVTITILDRQPGFAPIRVSELGIGSWSTAPDEARAADACIPLGSVDGAPLEAHLLGAAVPGAQVLFEGCQGEQITLGASTHRLRGDERWAAARLVLRDRIGEQVVGPGAVPDLLWTAGWGPGYQVAVQRASQSFLLVLGASHDARWAATDLGGATPVDGYANAWLVPAGASRDISLSFGPTGPATAGLAASAALVLVLLVTAAAGRGPTSVRGAARPDQAPAGAAREGVRWVGVVALAWIALGLPGAAAAVAVAAWHRFRPPRVRVLVALSLLLVALLPVAWWWGAPNVLLQPSTLMVSENLWPHRVACVLLVVVGVAVLRGEHLLRGRMDRDADSSEPTSTSDPGGTDDRVVV